MTFPVSDPRYFQILTLSSLLAIGLMFYEFSIPIISVLILVFTALITQYVCGKSVKVAFDPLSPLITSLSLCLLLRTSEIWVSVLAAVIAIGSKFVIRVNNKHLFNPANIGIITVVFLTNQAWISPGQWGNALLSALLLVCFAGLVLYKANRYDVSLMFLGSYGLCLFARAWWLGDPWTIPLHQLQSGTLLLFVFFMISDPKTTPDAQSARLLFALSTALLAYFLQFEYYMTTGLLLALTIMSLSTPLWNLLLPGTLYTWHHQSFKEEKSA